MTTSTLKTCTKCNESKPATREFFGSTPKGNLRGSCRTCMNARSRSFAQRNPESVRRRASLRRQQADGWTASAELKRSLFQEQDGCCALCCSPMDEADVLDPTALQVEHLTPLSKGGTHDTNNLVLAHRKCNQEKHGKTMREFVEWRARVGLPTVEFFSEKVIALLNGVK